MPPCTRVLSFLFPPSPPAARSPRSLPRSLCRQTAGRTPPHPLPQQRGPSPPPCHSSLPRDEGRRPARGCAVRRHGGRRAPARHHRPHARLYPRSGERPRPRWRSAWQEKGKRTCPGSLPVFFFFFLTTFPQAMKKEPHGGHCSLVLHYFYPSHLQHILIQREREERAGAKRLSVSCRNTQDLPIFRFAVP